jgi:mannan endo-1,4-beta-mannosidase
VRPVAAHALTALLALTLLALLSIPALDIVEGASKTTPVAVATARTPPEPKRLFGVYVDPWHVGEWRRRVGAPPQLVAKFEAFSKQRTIDTFLDGAIEHGIRRVMVTWEPWAPVPAAAGVRAQRRQQLAYRNIDIAWGAQDPYIRRFARSLARFKGVVYLRYAHEMNGFWYPWSADSRDYVLAWRRIVRIFRREGARNVRFVWSVNPSLYVSSRKEWLAGLRRYWPGAGYVDLVGATMIDFGGRKDYQVARFRRPISDLWRTYRKPLALAEVNTAYSGRVRWLSDLRAFLRERPWIRIVAWSQLPSRGQAHGGKRVGQLNWDASLDPASAAVVRGIIRDGTG